MNIKMIQDIMIIVMIDMMMVMVGGMMIEVVIMIIEKMIIIIKLWQRILKNVDDRENDNNDWYDDGDGWGCGD